MKPFQPRGYFVLLTLVFATVFFTLLSALSGYIFVQKKLQLTREHQEKALHLAEAGLEYYKWFLAHYPNDATDGTGAPGPYVHEVSDPEGAVLGTFSLDIDATIFCGEVSDLTIKSTGTPAADPSRQRTVQASYVRPSVARYSHIVDDNVWAGSDRSINGPYHSNKGIRMDGTNNAEVTSGVATWDCTGTFGCSPASTTPGVFSTITPHPGRTDLWEFPAPPIDFGDITVNLDTVHDLAQSDGIFIPKDTVGNHGYHLTFINDGTPYGSVMYRRVTDTTQVWGYSTQFGWEVEDSVIATTAGATTVPIPALCPIIYVEDSVWVDGVVAGKVLVAAADSAEAENPSVIINDNLTYASPEEDGITVIGENNVLVGLRVPDTMNIFGVFVAQKGRFGRNHYCQNNCSGGGGASNTGYKTTGSIPTVAGWSNMTTARINTSDNSKASCSATCDDADDAQLADFSFAVPAAATITGIEVLVEAAEGSSSGNIPTHVSLSWNSGTSFTATKSHTVDGTSDVTYTYGSSSDTWGRTWDPDEFANGMFRVRIDKATDGDTLHIDYVRVRVHYSTGVGLPSSLDPYVTRSTLNTTGTVVSKYRVGTKWSSGGTFVSGFSQRNDSFDQNLSVSPPPFTPWTSNDFRLGNWREVR